MEIINLTVDRIIIHQVFQRDDDNNAVEPKQGHDFIRFGPSAMSNFKSRVIDALGDDSKAVPMSIVRQDPGSVPALVDAIVEQGDADFATSSYDFAIKLTQAQMRQNLQGGILVVFTGAYGVPAKQYLGIIKADILSGYEVARDQETGEISLEYIEELLLTPGNRLFKAAGFFVKSEGTPESENLNDKWSVMLSDFQMKSMAQYFHEGFLGCGHPDTSARKTKLFYESTSKFIRAMDVDAVQKSDLLNALNVYLNVDTDPTVSVDDFSTSYFDEDTQDLYGDHMDEAGISRTAFTKDISDISSNLSTRRVKFRSKVNISAPAEAFRDLVTIEPIDGDPDEHGTVPEWTRVTIKDRIVSQE